MEETRLSCQSCGRIVVISPEEPPCKALKGWLTLSHWQGPEAVAQYSFCSFTCLKAWAEAQLPAIPRAFLDSFPEEER
ncbi:MAG: hypothetical protein HY670_09725 [Chloroflexi bacterium]|nr:hypothetical protein [Chloroflexota bacterium]